MEVMLQWGLDFIIFVQSFASPPLTAFMLIVTMLGSPVAYLVLIPLVYWCVDEKKGLHLGIVVLASAWLNITLKHSLSLPRLFSGTQEPSFGVINEYVIGGGFPSGHAQTSLVLFVFLALWIRKKWFWGIAAAICLLIAFSRIYLGMYFPTDILGGWIIGGLILFAYFKLAPLAEKHLERGGIRAYMLACAAASFIMIFNRPGEEPVIPAGLLLGIGAGYCLNKHYLGFESSVFFANFAEKSAEKRNYFILVARFLPGIILLLLILLALEQLLPRFQHFENYPLILFLAFGIPGVWITAGAPWLFTQLKLAKAPPLQASLAKAHLPAETEEKK